MPEPAHPDDGAPTSVPPPWLLYSTILCVPFVAAWLAFTAVTARDGRMPVTDWLDPFLAAATLTAILVVALLLVALWPHLSGPARSMAWLARGTVIAQWSYVFGEVLSNTITVGEPPQDIGSLLEFLAGGVALLVALGLVFRLGRKAGFGRTSRWGPVLTGVAAVLAVGALWWFTHPIDQSQPGAPACIPGNVLYNLFHQLCP